ncbi:MAG: hypothetical protein WCL07_00410 [bacterium]
MTNRPEAPGGNDQRHVYPDRTEVGWKDATPFLEYEDRLTLCEGVVVGFNPESYQIALKIALSMANAQ